MEKLKITLWNHADIKNPVVDKLLTTCVYKFLDDFGLTFRQKNIKIDFVKAMSEQSQF